jgi:hypothetical protein
MHADRVGGNTGLSTVRGRGRVNAGRGGGGIRGVARRLKGGCGPVSLVPHGALDLHDLQVLNLV